MHYLVSSLRITVGYSRSCHENFRLMKSRHVCCFTFVTRAKYISQLKWFIGNNAYIIQSYFQAEFSPKKVVINQRCCLSDNFDDWLSFSKHNYFYTLRNIKPIGLQYINSWNRMKYKLKQLRFTKKGFDSGFLKCFN